VANASFPRIGYLCCRGELFAYTNNEDKVLVSTRKAATPLATFRAGAYLWGPGLSPDGKALACGDNKGTLHLFRLDGKKDARRLAVPLAPDRYLHFSSVSFSPDGRRVAVACDDALVRVCDVGRLRWSMSLDGDRRQTAYRFHSPFHAVAYSPSGELLAALGEGKLIFWDAALGELIRSIDLREDPHRAYLAFSPDGRWLAASEGDHSVGVWEARSGQLVGRFRGHDNTVSGVCFLNGGRQVLSASHDKTLLLWDRSLLSAPPGKKGLDGAWEGLAEKAGRAHAWVWRMASSPGAVPYIAKRLTPAAARKGVTTDRVRQWAAGLSAKEAAAREEAAKQLAANLDYAEQTVLAAARKADTAEARKALKPLVNQIFLKRQKAERLRADRALAVLEQIGTAEAKKAMKSLAAGAPGHWLTEEARAALQRVEAAAARTP
jgi:hypothetical protein